MNTYYISNLYPNLGLITSLFPALYPDTPNVIHADGVTFAL